MRNPDPRALRRRVEPGQTGARRRAPKDPRLDRILEALETLVGQQARNQAAAAGTAAAAMPAPAPVPIPVDISLAGNGNGNQPMHKLVGELEKVFALLRCLDEDKVTLATYQLQENASTWWEATQRRVFPDDQYEAKFVELSKYAPRLVKDRVDKARRFRDGLKPEIKDQVVPLNLKDYDELYERAQLIERNLVDKTAAS
ncbi:uncharacterized protein LOC130136771 [Syzygium oleosum]|uniref:uncharacterized protein LOC130136771 n=1 Tax=Syzygium oleosum TaxID=219896 RepID=UPI0024B9FAE8|nr:uncharacterized protein LOC130136771 [Syzygium oleosum]